MTDYSRLADQLSGIEEPEEGPEEYTPEEAAYTDKGPAPFICAECSHFQGGTCDIVSGPISPQGSCIYWTVDEED